MICLYILLLLPIKFILYLLHRYNFHLMLGLKMLEYVEALIIGLSLVQEVILTHLFNLAQVQELSQFRVMIIQREEHIN